MPKIVLLFILLTFNLFGADNNQKISLQLKWKYQFQFAGFIVAKEKGFYKDAGLDVELKEVDSKIDIAQDVLKGISTFGVSDSALIYDKLKGKEVKALMPIFQESPFMLLGLKNNNLKTLDDLNGKTIALHKGVDGISIKAMLKVKDISFNSHPATFDFKKLNSGKIDLMSSYISNETFTAKELGMDIITFDPKDYGFDGYGDILFTSNSMVKENPDIVKKFYMASKKGWEYAFSNIDETVDIIYTKYNTLNKTKKALTYEAKVLRELSKFGQYFGEFSKERVKGIARQFNIVHNENNQLSELDNFIYNIPIEKIKVCYSTDMKPYNFLENGVSKGYGIDIMRLIEKNSNFEFEFIGVKGNREDFIFLKNKKCDIVPTVVTSLNITEFMETTIPYGVEHVGVATLMKTPFIEDLNSFKNKKIGFNKKYYNATAYLKKLYPDIDFILIDQKNMYKKLNSGELDAYLDGYMFLVNEINQKHYGMLKMNNMLYNNQFGIGMGVHKDNTGLIEKLNEIIKDLDPVKKEEILTKWRHFEIKKEIDYSLVVKVLLGTFTLLIASILVYIRDQKQKNRIQQLNKTLEKRVKEEVEKNRKKEKMMLHQSRLAQMGEMLSMIAHQWRQPLNNLSVLNQTIILKYKMEKLNDEIIETFKQNSKKQIQQMSGTIDDFSDFFKPDKEKSNFSLNESLKNIILILKPIFDKNQIKVNLYANDEIKLDSYKNELNQALLNILNNAADALIENSIEDKKIDIHLDVKNQEILLTIIDNAGGIEQSIMDKIFDPYFSTKNEKNGTGLGLYMSKIIIEDHMNGNVQAYNYEKGAVFMIKLPNNK